MSQQELTSGGTSNLCRHGLSWPYCCWCHSTNTAAASSAERQIKDQLDRVEGKLDELLKRTDFPAPVHPVNRFVKWVP